MLGGWTIKNPPGSQVRTKIRVLSDLVPGTACQPMNTTLEILYAPLQNDALEVSYLPTSTQSLGWGKYKKLLFFNVLL